jgi:hypothetical protein
MRIELTSEMSAHPKKVLASLLPFPDLYFQPGFPTAYVSRKQHSHRRRIFAAGGAMLIGLSSFFSVPFAALKPDYALLSEFAV